MCNENNIHVGRGADSNQFERLIEGTKVEIIRTVKIIVLELQSLPLKFIVKSDHRILRVINKHIVANKSFNISIEKFPVIIL